MKALFLSFLFCFAMPLVSHASDMEALKIKNLEELLQTYIEENKVLREDNKNLKIQLNASQVSSQNSDKNAEEGCVISPHICSKEDLCENATYGMIGQKQWKIGRYTKFVDEAKRRGLGCDVISKPQEDKTDIPVNKDEVETEVLTARDSCEADLVICNEAVLCELATYGALGNKDWKVENYTNFVEEAARRNINCGVSITAITALAEITSKEVVSEETQDIVAEIVRSNAREICDSNLAECRTVELCDLATFGMAGATEWKIGSYAKFVDEAKRRSENCGVLDEEQILSYKPDAELCAHATHESSKGLRWNVGSEKIFVEQAKRSVTTADVLAEVKRRSLDCNIKQEGLIDLDVAQIQTRLHHFGYEPGIVDGAWGGKTETAFKQFLTDNSQSSLSPNSLEAETFLYDLYEQKFEQTVRSSVPCKTITKDYERTNRGTCVVIAHFNETSSNLVHPDKGDETTAIWDKKGIYPLIREKKNGALEVILWAPDMSEKYLTIHDGPGLAHMANFPIDLKDIFIEKDKISVTNVSRKMPFSVRRYELEDMNKNGSKQLFLLGDREDGRKSGDKMIQGAYANQRDFKFIYDFEADQITTFGKKTKGHDYGLYDFNRDNFVDILDLNLHEINGQKGAFVYCDGKTLECSWRSTDQFINGNSFLEYDEVTDKVFLNARCGQRYVRDQNNGKFWLCWFSVEGQGPKLKFNFLQKFELQKKFDAKIKWTSWHGNMKSGYLGWKVGGYPINERVSKSAGGTATVFEDLDDDGDLDMITYRKDYYCVKKDKDRDYYNFDDCDQFTHSDYILIQENGKFELSQVIDGGVRDETINYDFEDLNRDGYPDIIPRGVYYGKCVDTYENILINNGDGTFNHTNEKFSGRYGCELASNFFEHDGQRYRAFTFKPEVKEHTFFDYDVYLAIEKLN
ncbi:peptidoglycan-binding protein [Amylibacter sp.]|nr:peptidoglycan-binding protein [Amylibacter sp.]